MKHKYDLSNLKVDDLDQNQPLGRFLILLFREFESEVISDLQKKGVRDISGADLNILRFIKPSGSQAVEIARLVGISKQAVGKLIESLEKRRIVRRKIDPIDGRAFVIFFTSRGENLIQEIIEIISRIETRYRILLGGEEYLKLKAQLKTLFDDHRTRN
jgi:DNA-binding MarR family transcriptional regulator